ncbi:aldehyde dehydrogenase family protein [Actinokineospora auranticolor]|uniref:aldehyde dehydrogenase (NAD(+)) n=1 Tax=Actinokineospora auranticolor TaxID=155976 RepID=A0A2S6GUY6_9PSEU|nr:aldehyde dehydrogenase family protein [Actinokineospora auranticolor]PPK69020.1 aldehyde dehydrogenase (NAD+) [Actinokineospora auranticolor]
MAGVDLSREIGHVIGGRVIEQAGERIEVVDPATGGVFATVPAGTAADVDTAVAAAAEAFGPWSATDPAHRAAIIRRVVNGLSAHRDTIASTISSEMGAPLGFAVKLQAGLPIATAAGVVDLLESGYRFSEEIGNSLVLREPVGVVGAITPWNYPLHQIVAKVVPALAAGNTVVLKPSEVAPLNANLFLSVLAVAGVPDGVVNLVHGTGQVVGEAIAAHPRVDMVSFTGSTAAGRRVAAVAAATVKRVALELGGKSANVVLDDADLPRAVKIGVANAFVNGGQTCTAWTRLLVPEDRHDEAAALAAAAAARYTVGHPRDEATRIGPMASAAQRDRVLGYLRTGVADGAELAYQADISHLPTTGAYVPPTVFSRVRQDMRIAQEEIFGPVLSILPYRTEDEAVSIANATIYGLAGAVFSADPERALAVAKRLRTGQVDINGGAFNPVAPFGGYKQSGNGRELGRHGLEEFTEVKSIQR